MKKIFISLILALALTLTACNTNDNPEPSETQPSSVSSTTSETQKIELTSEETQAPEEEPAKVFKHVSYADLPDAEQIYNSLYNWIDFKTYTTFDLHKDIGDEHITVDKIGFPNSHVSEEEIGQIYSSTYGIVESGRLSNGVDFATWLDSFASEKYVDNYFDEWFNNKFFVSDGKIYTNAATLAPAQGSVITTDLKVEKITTLDDGTIQIDFSYINHGVELDSDYKVSENFSFVMSQSNGWKIDSYEGGYADSALENELLRNEYNEDDLLTQLEEYIARHPISTAPTEETENSGSKNYSSCFIAPDPNTDPESVKFYDSYDCTPGYLYFNNARKQLLLDKKFKEAGYFQNDQLFYGITEDNELIEVDKSSGQYETVYKSDDDVKELDYSSLVILDDKGNETDMKGRLLYIRTDNSIVIIERETKEYSVISCPDGVSEIRTVGWQENEKINNKNDDVYICEECGYDGNYVIWRDNDGSWFWYHPETGENEPLKEMDTNKSYFVKAN